jgi:predicted nucleotidyltransferase
MNGANGLKDRDMRTIWGIFKKHPEVESVYLYGSRALSRHDQGSDIDLVLMNNVSAKIIREIKSDFEDSSLPYFVDVNSFALIKSERLREHILRAGIPFYESRALVPNKKKEAVA